jgi:hypothetical protein
MTDNTSITDQNRNLDYHFYFLFRTHLWKNEQHIQEPFKGKFDTIRTLGIQIDADKRLFRYDDVPACTPLAHWQAHLKDAWQKVLHEYANAYANASVPYVSSKSMEKALEYCQEGLVGVALIIMDEKLEETHKVTLDLYDTDYFKAGQSDFSYDTDNVLFSIRDKPGDMLQAAKFHAFKPIVEKQDLEATNWTLRLDKPSPYLMQRKPADSRNYPIFLVYGLAHGDADTVLTSLKTEQERQEAWPIKLAHILLGDVGEGLFKKTAILNSTIARLLISEAEFELLDYEARQLRIDLQKNTNRYFAIADEILRDTPNSVLETDLRSMEQFVVQTDYTLGRLSQAIKTLEINQENFEWRLNHLHHEEKEWEIDWQRDSKYPPLLEPFYRGAANLKNHVVYIEGKLTHLKGACSRWRSHITENRYNMTKHLGYLGHIITILVVLSKMGDVLKSHNPGNWLEKVLNAPYTYYVILGLYVIFFIYHYGNELIIWGKYKFRQLWTPNH